MQRLPWEAACHQSRRWLEAGCFEAMVCDLRPIIRMAQGRQGSPAQSCWMGEHCSPAARAAHVRATTATSAGVAARCIWQWIPWVICWRCTSRLPMSNSVHRCKCCASRYSRPRATPCNWLGQIKAIRPSRRNRQLRTTGLICRL